MKKIKTKALVLALLLALLGTVSAGTLAYFTASETTHNVITSGGVDIALEEWAENPDPDGDPLIPFENVSGVMPGAEVSKIVTVKNTGASEAWIRVKAAVSITLAEGTEGEADISLLDIDYNTEDWTEKDGYWYYNTHTKPGEVTEPLFTTVTFDKNMGNLYQSCTASVDVSAQAVQVANNGASAAEAAGWPEA